MTPLEILDLIIALLCLVDGIMYLLIPTGCFEGWFSFLSRKLKSKSRWTIPLAPFAAFLIFGYFVIQQVAILEIIPGIFLGGLLMKTLLPAQYPDETVSIIKKMSKRIDWFSLIMELLIAAVVLWILFLR